MSAQGEPELFVFDDIAEAAAQQAVARYPAGKQASAVLSLLDIAQRQMQRQTGSAWVPVAAMDAVAARLQMAPIRVYEIATFYTMYNAKPIGKFHLQVCTTTPCWLRGADDVVETCKKIAGLHGFGETTEDGLFTMSEVECLGGCVNAPILQINDDYYEDMDAARVESLLTTIKAGGELPAAGSTAGRTSTAPFGQQTTLLHNTDPAE